MPRTMILSSHSQIRTWVGHRHGHPAVASLRDRTGKVRHDLRLAFSTGSNRAFSALDDASMSPCSWTAWLAEFDRRWGAIEVPDSDQDEIKPYDVHFLEKATRH